LGGDNSDSKQGDETELILCRTSGNEDTDDSRLDRTSGGDDSNTEDTGWGALLLFSN